MSIPQLQIQLQRYTLSLCILLIECLRVSWTQDVYRFLFQIESKWTQHTVIKSCFVLVIPLHRNLLSLRISSPESVDKDFDLPQNESEGLLSVWSLMRIEFLSLTDEFVLHYGFLKGIKNISINISGQSFSAEFKKKVAWYKTSSYPIVLNDWSVRNYSVQSKFVHWHGFWMLLDLVGRFGCQRK